MKGYLKSGQPFWDRQKFLDWKANPQCDCQNHTPCPCIGQHCKLCVDDPRHGTLNGYTNLRCRCEGCRAANTTRLYQIKKQREQRVARGEVPEELHGTANGYRNWGCRCEPCRLAGNEDTRERTRRSRAGATDCANGLIPKPKRRSAPQ